MQLIILRGEVTEWLIFFDHPAVFKMFIKSRGWQSWHITLLLQFANTTLPAVWRTAEPSVQKC